MNKFTKPFLIAIVSAVILCAHPCRLIAAETNFISPTSIEKINPQLATFIVTKSTQAEALCKNANRPMPKVAQEFFAAAKQGDWLSASNAAERVWRVTFGHADMNEEIRNDVFRVQQPLLEIYGAWEQYRSWDNKFLKLFGSEIIASIPANSIYLGGTDPGRFLITTMCESHIDGRPFFTLTQNALADGSYLAYLTNTYGGKIYTPSAEDSKKCYQEYTEDAQARVKHDQDFPNEPRQLKPGEDISVSNGSVRVSGQVAVMAINARLVKVIFDKNPGRDFYVEESFPLDWVYPYLTPHRFIMKLNRKPVQEISSETMHADREFWTRQMDSWLGPCVNTNTSVREVTDFVERIYLKKDFQGFTGDQQFIRDLESHKAFSKLRSSIGGLYAWRATNSKDSAERQRMNAEADFAFRQAFVICPVNPETVYRYVNLLAAENRLSDAIRIVNTAHKLNPDYQQLEGLLENLIRAKSQADKAAPAK